MTLTDDGKRIYQRAKGFLAQEELLFKTEPLTQQQSLRIGTVEIFLLPICHQLKLQSLTDSPITLLDLNPGQIEQLVANRELDYGITYAPHPMKHVEIIEIEKYQLGCYHLSSYFDDANISEIPFAVPALELSNNPLGIKERDGWIESLTPRNRKYSVNLLSTGLELTLQGLCAIYIPKFIASNINSKVYGSNKLVEFPLPKTQKNAQHVFLIKHKDAPVDGQFTRLKKIVQSIVRG